MKTKATKSASNRKSNDYIYNMSAIMGQTWKLFRKETEKTDLMFNAILKDAWSNAKAMLVSYFSVEDGFWIHKRVEQEIAEAKVNKVKKHERAVKAAEARWKNASSNATSNTQAVLNECPSPSPSPSPINNNIDKVKNSRGSRFKEESLPEEWREYSLKTRPDLNPASVFEDFKDYWVSMAGSKGVRADWLATWRGWVRRQNSSSKTPKTAGDRNREVMLGLTRGLIGGENNVKLFGK